MSMIDDDDDGDEANTQCLAGLCEVRLLVGDEGFLEKIYDGRLLQTWFRAPAICKRECVDGSEERSLSLLGTAEISVALRGQSENCKSTFAVLATIRPHNPVANLVCYHYGHSLQYLTKQMLPTASLTLVSSVHGSHAWTDSRLSSSKFQGTTPNPLVCQLLMQTRWGNIVWPCHLSRMKPSGASRPIMRFSPLRL
jgi:hypothetical protein